jgi:sialic acid synthase SpsE
MDTGASLQYEVEVAVRVLRENGLEDIIVNHNPEGHPAPADKHNLRTINRLQYILGLPIGLADHYEGYEMLYAAAAIGANLLEKPISKDRFVPEPERNWSVSLEDLPRVLDTVKSFHDALGSSERTMSDGALAYRNNNRMACAAKKDLEPGEKMDLDNVTFGRPRKGIGVEFWDLVEGRALREAKKRYEFIQWGDLD